MKIYSKQLKKTTKKGKVQSFKNHWTTGVSRRNFVKSSVVASLLMSISGCKPTIEASNAKGLAVNPINLSDDIVKLKNYAFNKEQQLDLQAIYMRLFPDDGNGPSANDLNAVTYLEWAMKDKRNINDGDPEFIAKGIGWLNQLANDEVGTNFRAANTKEQDKLITQTITSKAGRNWVSILTYYLIEAITLDPYYGGNTNQVGWKWLEHQGGFPQPMAGKTYKDFD